MVLINLYLLAAVVATTPNSQMSRSIPPLELTACSIATRADVEDAIGRQVNNGKEEIQGRASTCDYAAKGGLVSITIQRLTDKPNLRVELAALKKEVPEGVIRNATDFPEAFYFDIPGGGTQLHIISDKNEHLMISILGFGEASQVSGAATQIARRAMRRL
jgi:hypothetical protein